VSAFWQTLPQPIVALAPMDGVSDAPFRQVQAEIGRPDIVFTEFTNVEGLWRGDLRLLDAFLYDDAERPVVAQLFGTTPQDFYRAAVMVCELGFDGVDINMGCPSKCVAGKGGGAGLIRTPLLAQEIVRATRRGVEDWANGQTLEGIGLAPERIARIRQMNQARRAPIIRRRLPVSVKTRLGYDSIIIEDWIKVLLEVEPVAISLHGRTLRQMYKGAANWEAIGRAAEIVRQTPTLLLGNGDIHSAADARRRLRETGVHGVLVGRASMGNPWLFRELRAMRAGLASGQSDDLAQAAQRLTAQERLQTALRHARLFTALLPNHRFVELRKHLSWYCRDFSDAAALRRQLVQASSLQELEQMLASSDLARAFLEGAREAALSASPSRQGAQMLRADAQANPTNALPLKASIQYT
jgi:tRNA-dihydrouridine synthase B